ncbi:MAG: large repetitive protein [Phycisphaerales bacterium]|nr:large repetitive protein [Phycisphaerales bacterium]
MNRGERSQTIRAAVIETLEGRRLLSLAIPSYASAFSAWPASSSSVASKSTLALNGAVPLAVQPMITGSTPANGAGDVPRYQPITFTVQLASSGAGIDPATLNLTNVKIRRTSDQQFINANVNTDAAGASITIQPTALLAAFTQYTISVTSGLKDTNGNAFVPFSATFTTGAQVPAQDPNIVFSKADQAATANRPYASLAWGPDNKLYAGTLDGHIVRYTVNSATGALSAPEQFNTVNANNSTTRFIIGMAFDPASTAGNLILWVSHSEATNLELPEAPDWTGKISRLSGPGLGTYQDYVIGLPRSVRDHLTNQPKFGPDGALYVSQPSMNAMGAADPAWVRADHPLSGAILRIDLSKITSAPVNVRTPDGGGSYNPSATNAPVKIYATGVRNSYDLVWHSNGHLYAPANGSAAGGDTLAGPGGSPPAMTNVQETMHDYLFDIVPGKYYGQPNQTRNQLILNGGNPTSGIDRNEVVSYPVGTQPDPNYGYSAFDFGQNYAPTGAIEYKNATAFGGALKGRILVTRYSGGDDILILSPSPKGTAFAGINGVNMDGFNDPTDIIEDPRNGNLYVAQLGTPNSSGAKNVITLLKPDFRPYFTKLQLINADAGYSLGALKSKSTINLADLPTKNLSIKALTEGATRVVFELDGVVQDENSKPYAVRGNNPDGSYIPWTPSVGMHSLTATPYNANGTPGITAALVFWIVDQPRPFSVNVNFQPVDTPAVKGYKSDWGRLYALRGNGLTYGWNKNAAGLTYDRNLQADQRFDTGVAPGGRKWDIAVPNGSYSVHLMGGDLGQAGTYNVAVEGVATLVGKTTAANPWIGKTVQVNVTDNTLSVTPLAGNINHKLAFIQIVST